jgi:hypothetical protein
VACYLRFLACGPEAISLEEIGADLAASDPRWRIDDTSDERSTCGDLYLGDELLAELEVNRPGDELFEEERDQLLQLLPESGAGEALERVRNKLQGARAIVVVRALFPSEGRDGPFERLSPLWRWLFEHREGILQVDGEGYFERGGFLFK